MDERLVAMHLRAGEAYGREATCGPAVKPKVKHINEDVATRAAASLNRQTAKTHDVEPYPCFWCGSWHVGRAMTLEEVERYSMPVQPDGQ